MRALNAEFLHPAAQCIWMEIEDQRRAVRSFDHTAGLFENPEDVLALHLFKTAARLAAAGVGVWQPDDGPLYGDDIRPFFNFIVW